MKHWAFTNIGNQIQYAGAGKAGLAPLILSMGTHTVLGGIKAAPLIGAAAMAWGKFTEEGDLDSAVYSGFENEGMADMLLYGLPSVFGLSLTSQIAGFTADPSRDASLLTSFAFLGQLQTAGKAAMTSMDSFKTGRNPFADPLFRDQLSRATLPRTVYRAIAAGEDNAIRSLQTGYDVSKVSVYEATLYGFGFNPVQVDKAYAAVSDMKNDQRKARERQTAFGRAIAESLDAGDSVLATRMYYRAMAEGVDMSSLARSVDTRRQRLAETQLEQGLATDDVGSYAWMRN
jgi:hypothetical protein